MTGFEIAIGVVLIILSLVIIAVILLQEGRQLIWARFKGLPIPFLKGQGSHIGCSTGKVDKDNCNSLLCSGSCRHAGYKISRCLKSQDCKPCSF